MHENKLFRRNFVLSLYGVNLIYSDLNCKSFVPYVKTKTKS